MQTSEGCRALPSIAQRHGLLAAVQVKPAQRGSHGRRDGAGVEFFSVEWQLGRDDRQVAQRQRCGGLDEDGAAADLHGVLRRADHRGANALLGRFDARPPSLHAAQNGLRECRAEVAVTLHFTAVDVFRDAAGEGHDIGRGASGQRIEPQQGSRLRAECRAMHGLEQTLCHALDQSCHAVGVGRLAIDQTQADFISQPLPGHFNPLHATGAVQANDARPNVDGRLRHHRSTFAQRNLRRAAADVDVHHTHALADAACRRARTHGGQRGF